MTPRWRVGMNIDAFTVHTWFPLAGLSALAARGEVELRWISRRLPEERAHWLEVEDREARVRVAVCVDVTDRPYLTAPARSARADLTWKRSFDPAGYGGTRVVPFGIPLKARSGHEPLRSLALRSWPRARAARRDLPPLVADYESPPGGAPRVLFQVRAWAPVGPNAADRAACNHERAELIRALRADLGDAFVGGFVPTPLAREHYPDCLTDRPTDRAAYLALVRGSTIAVSTRGLHASNPYKLAEYDAASRAIVTQPLAYLVPDPHPAHAVFDGVEACVSTCRALLDDADRVAVMQSASAEHWRVAGRPDVLVRRRLVELPAALD